jgi:hypothetical protein
VKKMVLACVLIMVWASVASSQEKWESPSLNIGDRWKYRDKSGGEWTQQVTAIENDVYVVRHGKETRGYERSTMNFNFVAEDGKRFKFTGSWSKVLNFPLYIGKQWTNQFSMEPKTGGSRRVEKKYLEEYLVPAFEEVSVLGGTIKAVKSEYKSMSLTSMKQTAKTTYWYSPEVKAIIKRVEEISHETKDMELISYELK